MTNFTFSSLPASLSVITLNHLLTQSGWATQKLVGFAGKTARFDIAPFSFAYTILPDGTVSTAADNAVADAICNIPPSLLPRLLLKDETAYTLIQTSGETAMLSEIFYLSKNLNWDAAEDLSQITGDIAAERLVQFAASAQQTVRAGIGNLSQALAEYWTEERPLVAKSAHINRFVQQVDTLRDDVARLEQRINRLTKT